MFSVKSPLYFNCHSGLDPESSVIEFLNGQKTVDTAKWVEGFEKYRSKGIYGKEAVWIGKPMFGNNRMAFRASSASEEISGRLQTKWEAPIAMDLFVEKEKSKAEVELDIPCELRRRKGVNRES